MSQQNSTPQTATQNLIVQKGEDILKRMESQSKISLFSKDFWYGSIVDWSMKNEKFKFKDRFVKDKLELEDERLLFLKLIGQVYFLRLSLI